MPLHLPIDEYLGKIAEAVCQHRAVVIQAEPGAGKTTRVPLAVSKVVDGLTIVLEPRRLAAKLTALHMASELQEKIGESVGYQIRYEKQVSERTRVLFVTEGLFLRMLNDDPHLNEVSCVILDEFHERNLHTDMALGAVRYLQNSLRPDLRLVVMSATMDVARLVTYLGAAAEFKIPGRTFPVAIEYRPYLQMQRLADKVAQACAELLVDPRCPASVLVFLPGTREILDARDVCLRRLRDMAVDIVPLTAELPPAKQQLAFEARRRKVILATNVAETSLTLPGVTGVVDSGLAKIAGHAHWSGMPTLHTKDISQASAEQRAGRAGRVQAGVVVRLYDESSYLARESYTPPEVVRVDLASCVLQILALSAQGWSRSDQFPWFEVPDDRQWDHALTLLRRLGFVDPDGAITDAGKMANDLPVHPRVAAVMMAARQSQYAGAGILAGALISEGFILRRLQRSLDRRSCDVLYQLEVLRAKVLRQDLPHDQLERAIDERRVAAVLKLARTIASRWKIDWSEFPQLPEQSHIGEWVLQGFCDRVAKLRVLPLARQKKQRSPLYHFCLGRGGSLGEQSVLSGNEDYIIAIDAQEDLQHSDAAKSTMIRAGSRVTGEQLTAMTHTGLVEQRQEERLHPQSGRADRFLVTYYGDFSVSEERLEWEGGATKLREKMLSSWPWPFPNDDYLRSFNTRSELLEKYQWPAKLPLFSGEMLELLIHAIADDARNLDDILSHPLSHYVVTQLSYEEQELLRTIVPDELRLPNGKALPLAYDEHGCSMHGFIQDFFGLTQTPTLLEGRCPIRLHLLGPSKRPAQVTTDLTGFWQSGYFEVRKELQRRYPRHYWPDHPEAAHPHLTKRQAQV